MEAVHPAKRMRSGSHSKDGTGLASCIPRPPAMDMGTGMGIVVPPTAAATATATPPTPPTPPTPLMAVHVPRPTLMDMDRQESSASLAFEASAFVETFVDEATAAPSSPTLLSSESSEGSDSSGSESDVAAVLAPGELARGCTFDEACRMLLENAPYGDEDHPQAGDGPCALEW
mmetsp:Transcript_13708/g.23983  ORF Transcript_13708/g.23983 Transcript_13708/m.23983 type:complete len:174 (+) Transcript_13708:688-1209(+)